MRELFNLTEAYGFKAPLISFVEDDYELMMKAINVSRLNHNLVSFIKLAAEECKEHDLGIISFEHLSTKLGKSITSIRSIVSNLEELGFCDKEFITTDPIRKRRGSLYHIIIPQSTKIKLLHPTERLFLSHITHSEQIKIPLIGQQNNLYSTELALNVFSKLIRISKNDKRSNISIKINIEKQFFNIKSEAVNGDLAYLDDLVIYSSLISWLAIAIKVMKKNSIDIGETYDIPISDLLMVSMLNLNTYVTGPESMCKQALIRLSGTRFDLTDITEEVILDYVNENNVKSWFSFFNLEGFFNSNEQGVLRLFARVQFPKYIIDNILYMVEQGEHKSLINLSKSVAFHSENKTELLFYLWLRQQKHFHSVRGSYTWEELHQNISPQSTLTEFKLSFSKMLLLYADRDYVPRLYELDENDYTKDNGLLIKTTSNGPVVQYGQSTMYGVIVNVGLISKTQVSLYFRLDNNAILENDRHRPVALGI